MYISYFFFQNSIILKQDILKIVEKLCQYPCNLMVPVAYMPFLSLGIFRKKEGIKVKLGVVAVLYPVRHIHSYKLPHHENKNENNCSAILTRCLDW